MFDTCVLGVDPGVARCGVAAVVRRDRRTRLEWAGTIRTSGDASDADRLRAIASGMRQAITRFAPSSVAIETRRSLISRVDMWWWDSVFSCR